MSTLIATQLGAEWLLKSLDASTSAGSKMLDSVWSLLLQGELYREIAKLAASLIVVPLGLFVINYFRNRRLDKLDARLFTGDAVTFLLIGMIIFSLCAPARTGSLLYGMRQSTVNFSNKITEVVSSIAGDPTKAMAAIIAGRSQQAAGVSLCNSLGVYSERVECLKSLEEGNQRLIDASIEPSRGISVDGNGTIDFGTTIQEALQNPILSGITGAVGKVLAFDGDMMILSLVVPMLMSLGTMFILCLEVGVLVACLLLPFTLLIAIADRGVLVQWFKSFWSFSLINVAYKIIISSVAFAMMAAGFTDVLLYGLIAGLGAPILAVQVVAGNNTGILSTVGNAASRIVGR